MISNVRLGACAMNAETISEALRGHKVGSGWMACCPVHNDRTPSLSVRDTGTGKVLVRCHAGCDQHTVISALKSSGLWPDNDMRLLRLVAPPNITDRTELDHDEDKRTKAALKLWQSAMPSRQTLVEPYFHRVEAGLP
jgi:hypothetical protein